MFRILLTYVLAYLRRKNVVQTGVFRKVRRIRKIGLEPFFPVKLPVSEKAYRKVCTGANQRQDFSVGGAARVSE